jgi:hypothetical protein
VGDIEADHRRIGPAWGGKARRAYDDRRKKIDGSMRDVRGGVRQAEPVRPRQLEIPRGQPDNRGRPRHGARVDRRRDVRRAVAGCRAAAACQSGPRRRRQRGDVDLRLGAVRRDAGGCLHQCRHRDRGGCRRDGGICRRDASSHRRQPGGAQPGPSPVRHLDPGQRRQDLPQWLADSARRADPARCVPLAGRAVTGDPPRRGPCGRRAAVTENGIELPPSVDAFPDRAPNAAQIHARANTVARASGPTGQLVGEGANSLAGGGGRGLGAPPE